MRTRNNSDSIGSSGSSNQQHRIEEQERKVRLLKTLTLITTGCQLGLLPTYLGGWWLVRDEPGSGLILFGAAFALFAVLMYQVSRLIAHRHYVLAVRLFLMVTFSQIAFGAFIVGLDGPVIATFVFPIALAVALATTTKEIVITSLVCALYGSSLYLADYFGMFKPFALPAIIKLANNVLDCSLVLPAIAALISLPMRGQTNLLERRNDQLATTLQELELRQQQSQAASSQVLALASSLNATASQQAAGSSQQVCSVVEINASISELASTSHNLAELAGNARNNASEVARYYKQLEIMSRDVVKHGLAGMSAINSNLTVSDDVAEHYGQVMEAMDELNQKSTQMAKILSLIGRVASDTHLLSINAAIEAAGAGAYGERFGVVAQQVKFLAASSSKASKEVEEIIKQVEAATSMAVNAARVGSDKVQKMAESAYEAGQIIEQMRHSADAAYSQAEVIMQAAGSVEHLSAIVSRATEQQRSASEQVLEALSGLAIVAEQNEQSSRHVFSAATSLEGLSINLNQVLVRTAA